MSVENRNPSQEVIDAIAASGFPLQTAVARLVAATQPFELVHEEYPWVNQAGATQFLDIIARHGAAEFPIECKKAEKQSWIFLRPDEGAPVDTIERVRALFTCPMPADSRRLELHVGDWNFNPPSSESRFCVVSGGQKGTKERLIEPEAQLLIGATDSYAQQRQSDPLDPGKRPYVPLLVTTAPLFMAPYKSERIPLDTGRLALEPASLREVPWVRFRKTFTAGVPLEISERTVMVVNARHLSEFLKLLNWISPYEPLYSMRCPAPPILRNGA